MFSALQQRVPKSSVHFTCLEGGAAGPVASRTQLRVAADVAVQGGSVPVSHPVS